MNASGAAALLASLAVALLGSMLPTTSSRSRPATARHGQHQSVASLVGRFQPTLTARRLRRADITPLGVAEWCDAITRQLRGGLTLRSALQHCVPSSDVVAQLTAPMRLAIERGRSLSDAAAQTGALDRRGIEHLHLATGVIATTSEVGGSAAAPLDRVAAVLRLRAADQQERAAHSAQAQLSAHVLTVVPAGMLSLLIALDTDVRSTVTSPVGILCVSAGLILNGSGWTWMRRIIRGRP